jgi:two-component system, chemotaxis family, chemotaxis protein CheY
MPGVHKNATLDGTAGLLFGDYNSPGKDLQMNNCIDDAPDTLRAHGMGFNYEEALPEERMVMVVDDDYAIREALSDVLGGLGFSVVQANHGEHAMSLLAAGCKPFAILLDLGMPVMNGWQFKDMLLSKPEYADIRIIVITAAHGAEAGLSGVAEVLTKPIPLQRLIEALNVSTSSA